MQERLTTTEAAALAGITAANFTSAMARRRRRGDEDLRLPPGQWLDGRTPTYDANQIRAWVAARPGPGRWGRRDTGPSESTDPAATARKT